MGARRAAPRGPVAVGGGVGEESSAGSKAALIQLLKQQKSLVAINQFRSIHRTSVMKPVSYLFWGFCHLWVSAVPLTIYRIYFCSALL